MLYMADDLCLTAQLFLRPLCLVVSNAKSMRKLGYDCEYRHARASVTGETYRPKGMDGFG